MGIQNIRNRAEIKDPHVLALIKECVGKMKDLGYHVPTKLRFLQCKAKERAGLACYRDITIVLSTFIFEEEDNYVKQVIYHELGHIVAGPNTHHGPVWKTIMRKIEKATNLTLERCYSPDQMPKHSAAKKQKEPKYRFRCTKCGKEIFRDRLVKFVKTYDEKLPNGKPRWTCTHCGGSFEMIK